MEGVERAWAERWEQESRGKAEQSEAAKWRELGAKVRTYLVCPNCVCGVWGRGGVGKGPERRCERVWCARGGHVGVVHGGGHTHTYIHTPTVFACRRTSGGPSLPTRFRRGRGA